LPLRHATASTTATATATSAAIATAIALANANITTTAPRRRQRCGKRVDCAKTDVRGVWAAAKEHLIVAYFCGGSPYFLPR
jgi:hypothetical protein